MRISREVFCWEISAAAKLVYCNMCRWADPRRNAKTIPLPDSHIAEDCSLSIRKTKLAIQELIDAGVIYLDKIRTRETLFGEYQGMVYILKNPDRERNG